MSIILPSSTCIGHGSGGFRRIHAHQRQYLDVHQSGVAWRKLLRIHLVWIKHSSCGVSIIRSDRSRTISSQPCLPETIDYLASSCYMKIKIKINFIYVDTSLRHFNPCVRIWKASIIPHTQIISNYYYVLMCSSNFLFRPEAFNNKANTYI